MNSIAKTIEIGGIVQGVGFRPFIYQKAFHYGLYGYVANTSNGVIIHVQGGSDAIDAFINDIISFPPPLSCINDFKVFLASCENLSSFSIRESLRNSGISTLISPDIAVCNDCFKELSDSNDRRYRYPFINCTNCGPRYTIIDDIPYDRPNTSMRHFKMCPACEDEYHDPNNRRFHAQPNACHVCGPRVSLIDNRGNLVAEAEPVKKTAELLRQGCIIAIKGLGGFHLAANATDEEAVSRLRANKLREEKPFALMSHNIHAIRGYAYVSPEEETILTSRQRPIVLLHKKTSNPIACSVAPKNKYFGVMLPYTPLHYLILDIGLVALVMTSGNLSNEPICIDNQDAIQRLGNIANYLLIHDRDILLRSDDSIVRRAINRTCFIRRSRGYVPAPVFLKHKLPQILACGAELKNTVSITKDQTAFLSQHIGDLKNLETYKFFTNTIERMKRILGISPEIIACDLHPDYLSTRYAETQKGVGLIRVQHHHAHIVSCMAEHQLEGEVLGLAFDGTGYGEDGSIWGGEVLISRLHSFQRIAHLAVVPMPGGDAAIKEPWRMAISYLYDTFGDNMYDLGIPLLSQIDRTAIKIVIEMIKKEINSPITSSLGRLFDGIAAITGLRTHVNFEGEAAMELEMAMDNNSSESYEYDWKNENNVRVIQLSPIIKGVVRDVISGMAVSRISSRFHMTLINLFSALCEELRDSTHLDRVALSGGCFQNLALLSGMTAALERRGFQVFSNTQVPANDGGVSLGQAVVATKGSVSNCYLTA
ncbi:MAG: carbamoyltransferase HypF [Pseudomonadota bacterium]